MPKNVFGFVVLPLEELYLGVFGNRTVKVHYGAVYACGKHLGRQPGRYTLGDFIGSYAFYKGLYAAVGKSDINHSLQIYRKSFVYSDLRSAFTAAPRKSK